ncbi:MAG: zinc ribbon domain-containing protein [Dehalococcoidia bacterium]|nr:zinc ribbon domain-containing protein [Dehalococcoidia bacterium]
MYPFHCDACGAEFEVSRKVSAMRDPAACPACGTDARRVFTAVALGGVAEDPAKAAKRPQPGGWSHQGHSHGAGTGAHSHGLWDQPAPAPKPPPSA